MISFYYTFVKCFFPSLESKLKRHKLILAYVKKRENLCEICQKCNPYFRREFIQFRKNRCFSKSDWFTESRLLAIIPVFDLKWKMSATSVAWLEIFRPLLSENSRFGKLCTAGIQEILGNAILETSIKTMECHS